MKALIVDDSAVMRKILIGALARADLTDADQAADGKEAVAACAANTYDLVLMDWNMPNMLGIDALKAIRASDNKVPVIMVTTEAEKSRIVEAIKSGASDYIVEPFEPDERTKRTIRQLRLKPPVPPEEIEKHDHH